MKGAEKRDFRDRYVRLGDIHLVFLRLENILDGWMDGWDYEILMGKHRSRGFFLQIARNVCLDVSDEWKADMISVSTVSWSGLVMISMHSLQMGWHCYVEFTFLGKRVFV